VRKNVNHKCKATTTYKLNVNENLVIKFSFTENGISHFSVSNLLDQNSALTDYWFI